MDCIFCKIINGDIPSYKIYEDDLILAFLDINPNSPGHTLVVPKSHTMDMFTITDNDLNYIMKKAKDIAKLLETKLNFDGVSFAQNNGICQEVKHFHLHIIPKYNKTKKISIQEVYEKITQ